MSVDPDFKKQTLRFEQFCSFLVYESLKVLQRFKKIIAKLLFYNKQAIYNKATL